jgi:manganese transport protein
MTGAIAFGILGLHRFGFRRFELVITGLLGIIFLGFLYETLRIGPSARGSLGGLIPGLDGTSSLYLAVGIIGATVMPHVIYLHSALTQDRMPCRDDRERSRVLRFERTDVITALGLAGLVNMAMLAVAANLFHTPALSGLSTLQQAHHELGRLAGGTVALAFAVALLASGASSSSVGTYAGQVVMAGFVNLRIPPRDHHPRLDLRRPKQPPRLPLTSRPRYRPSRTSSGYQVCTLGNACMRQHVTFGTSPCRRRHEPPGGGSRCRPAG